MKNNEQNPELENKPSFGSRLKRVLPVASLALALAIVVPVLGNLSTGTARDADAVETTLETSDEINLLSQATESAEEDTIEETKQKKVIIETNTFDEDLALLMNTGLNRSGNPLADEIDSEEVQETTSEEVEELSSGSDETLAAEETTEAAEETEATTSTTAQATTTTVNNELTVRSGEGWWHLGERSGVDYRYLAAFNDMSSEEAVYAGTVLRIPTAAELAEVELPTTTTSTTRETTRATTTQATTRATTRATTTQATTRATTRATTQATTTTQAPTTQATTTQAPTTTAVPTTTAAPSVNRSRFLATGQQYIGIRYAFGGASTRGFDCSGFTKYVFAQYGYYLPHSATQQYYNTTRISNPEPGDLVFFSASGSYNNITHVAIYAGNGQILGAHSNGISYRNMWDSYWAPKFIGYGRVA